MTNCEKREKPDPNVIHPIAGYDKEIYVKPTITNPNIIVGDFTYIADIWHLIVFPAAHAATEKHDK